MGSGCKFVDRIPPADEAGAAGAPRPGHLRPYSPPRDDIERELIRLWQRWLGLEEIGVDDDFLEIGGNSLLAMRTVAYLSETYQTRASVRDVFGSATVAALALLVREQLGTKRPAPGRAVTRE